MSRQQRQLKYRHSSNTFNQKVIRSDCGEFVDGKYCPADDQPQQSSFKTNSPIKVVNSEPSSVKSLTPSSTPTPSPVKLSPSSLFSVNNTQSIEIDSNQSQMDLNNNNNNNNSFLLASQPPSNDQPEENISAFEKLIRANSMPNFLPPPLPTSSSSSLPTSTSYIRDPRSYFVSPTANRYMSFTPQPVPTTTGAYYPPIVHTGASVSSIIQPPNAFESLLLPTQPQVCDPVIQKLFFAEAEQIPISTTTQQDFESSITQPPDRPATSCQIESKSSINSISSSSTGSISRASKRQKKSDKVPSWFTEPIVPNQNLDSLASISSTSVSSRSSSSLLSSTSSSSSISSNTSNSGALSTSKKVKKHPHHSNNNNNSGNNSNDNSKQSSPVSKKLLPKEQDRNQVQIIQTVSSSSSSEPLTFKKPDGFYYGGAHVNAPPASALPPPIFL